MQYQSFLCTGRFIFVLRWPTATVSFRLPLGSLFLFCVDNILSVQYPKETGVMQGSLLSDTLFTHVISVMVSLVGPFFATLLYVDNVAIFHSSCITFTVTCQLRVAVNCHTGLWRMNFPSVRHKPSVCT